MKLNKQEALSLLTDYCGDNYTDWALERLMDYTFDPKPYTKDSVLLTKNNYVHHWILDDIIYRTSDNLAKIVTRMPMINEIL